MCGLWQQWTGTNLTAALCCLLLPSSCVPSPTRRPYPVSMLAYNTETRSRSTVRALKWSPQSVLFRGTLIVFAGAWRWLRIFLCRLMLSSLLHAFTIQATILLGDYCVAGRILGDLWISNEEFAAHFAEWVLWCLSVAFPDSRQFPS